VAKVKKGTKLGRLLGTDLGIQMSRQRATFDALPYYDEDGSNNPELTAQVAAELAKERKRLGQRLNTDNDPRIPPQFNLFPVSLVTSISYFIQVIDPNLYWSFVPLEKPTVGCGD
jgi:hypothetical protein